LLGEWEFYAGLRQLGLPVDLIAYPGGSHSLVRPSQRIASTEGALDWFDFWLNGHEVPDPAKGEEYKRWENLCDMQVDQNPINRHFASARSRTEAKSHFPLRGCLPSIRVPPRLIQAH